MKLETFENRELLELELSKHIAQLIKNSLLYYRDARLLLSGGSTPLGVYKKLADMDNIIWKDVLIGTVDDRMIPIDHPASNFGVIQRIFQKPIEKGAELYPMYKTNDWDENMKSVDMYYQFFKSRIDFVLLGMGNDGHTASLFPTDEASLADLENSKVELLYTSAPVEPKHRMTCSKALLARAEYSALMLVGEEKMRVFEQAEEQNLPIHQVIKHYDNLKVFYSK